MVLRPASLVIVIATLTVTSAQAQSGAGDMSNMPGMDMPAPAQQPAPQPPAGGNRSQPVAEKPGMAMPMPSTGILGAYPMTRDASGTSWQPDAATHAGIHFMMDDWMLMAHLRLVDVYDSQSGPRGDDKAFVEGMAMLAARRDLASGDTLNLRAMLSPDPFMGRSGYPLLLASGETANGTTPLIDRQHPHDLFMELAASYAHPLSAGDSIFVYAGYPGEPALGPPAFMHRASGEDIPQAPITHHWMDSTHITFGVATVGWVHYDWKFEVSQFTGREPDESRFDFDAPTFDSTSARVTFDPDAHWSFQASWGDLHSPEQLDPSVDETRLTASASYVTAIGDASSLAATLGWGLKQERPGPSLNGVLFEIEYKPADLWTLFARAEWEQNAELAPNQSMGRGVEDVRALDLGIIRDFALAEHWKIGIGASYTFDVVQRALTPNYGGDPHGAMLFVRLIAE